MSERDVVFTPFMLRVRDAVSGTLAEPAELRFEPSPACTIALAVDEWFSLRARAEHVIAEANAMLDPGAERIELRDEFGTGVLAFELSWRDRWLRLLVYGEERAHQARVEMDRAGGAQPVKPVDLEVLEDLLIDMLCRPEVGQERR